MYETEEKGQLFTVNVQAIYLIIFNVNAMCKCLLPYPTSTFFPVLNTLLFLICNIVICIHFKLVVLIGIASVDCTRSTTVVQLTDDFSLDYFHRPNYLFMFRFTDIICWKVRYLWLNISDLLPGEKLPQNSRTVFLLVLGFVFYFILFYLNTVLTWSWSNSHLPQCLQDSASW